MNDTLDRIEAAMPLVLAGVALATVMLLIALVIRVVRKAGYSPWWAIGVFVPGVNLVLLVMFATVQWPVESRLADAERRLTLIPRLGGMTPYVAPPMSPEGAESLTSVRPPDAAATAAVPPGGGPVTAPPPEGVPVSTAPPPGVTAPPPGVTAPPPGVTAPPPGVTVTPPGVTTGAPSRAPHVPARSSGPASGAVPVHRPATAASATLPVVAPPTFTAMPYPAGYGPPPATGDGGPVPRQEPAEAPAASPSVVREQRDPDVR
ncbi:hypothetical protein [Cellulomonas sp. P24]|uniref:hypothetical protein n=1 Tax=Cellulomonas sp. P24 TaxID=2885206 RepID=UPI00216B08AE|nr:hypothetical protein [Cellulomonas sp. P24]MCR6492751.1 hypothetical protein [Cellulomonas sp. P24]